MLELAGGVAAAKYVRGINLVYSVIGSEENYYLYNGHGDVVQLVSAAEAVTKEYDYDAFGNEKDIDGEDTNPFRYCGEYYDAETGTYYLRARYYDPVIGRFTSEDLIQSGLNWYTYCGNNPINYIDPWGLWMQGDEALSAQAQVYIRYYTGQWDEANTRFQNATTDAQRAAARADMDNAHALADDIRRLNGNNEITGNFYDVPILRQGNLNLCWAYSQTVIEAFHSGITMSQQQADTRARAIAESVYGPENWNRGGWPTNSLDVTSERRLFIRRRQPDYWVLDQTPSIQSAGDFTALAAFVSDGPVYGYFSNTNGAHLIVITGAVSAAGHVNLVTSNNPWGMQNIQTYNDFTNLSGMTFGGVLRVTH